MIILLFLLICLGISILLKCLYGEDSAWEIGIGLSSCFLIAYLLISFSLYFSTKSEIKQFEMVRDSLIEMRKSPHYLENAALSQKIIELNQWLVDSKYWNNEMKIIGDIFVPDEIDELELLK